MVGFIVQSSSLNSFGSICYCGIVLGIHTYACYKDITRYQEAQDRAWPSNGAEPPTEVSLLLAWTIISLLIMPLFCVTAFVKVGNLANDGVKLGRDQEERPSVENDESKNEKHEHIVSFGFLLRKKMRYLWKHFCPVAQTLHLLAAFLLLLPEVLLTAEEIKNGYKSPDISWESELDFLFPAERSTLSHIRSSVNLTTHPNATTFDLSATLSASKGWGDRVSVSIAFVHLCIALVCFLVRYASVFWYTNKALTLIIAFQLLSVVINSIFGFNSFATLYCICHNQKLFRNIHLSVACSVDLTLYLFSGAILLLSTITLFEYGSHYFHEKSKIIERNHATDTFMRRTVIVNSGCQGFIPHSCAMGALVLYVIFKGPLIYDMIHLMRVTSDQLMLSSVICEVCYMVTWVTLWFGLTIKQKWRFRILDYVTLRHAKSLPLEGSISRLNSRDQGDHINNGSLGRLKRHSSGSNVPVKCIETSTNGTASASSYGDQRCPSDIGTDESDPANMAMSADVMNRDSEGRFIGDFSSLKRQKPRRNTGVRVKFHDSSTRLSTNSEDDTPMFGSLVRRASFHRDGTEIPPVDQQTHIDVKADIHSASRQPFSTARADSSQTSVNRRYSEHRDSSIPMDYRNSLRNKCGEYYHADSHSPSTVGDVDSATDIPPMEPLPTLMSSFRDRVRESSLAASNFKENERQILEHYHTYDEHINTQDTENLDHNHTQMREPPLPNHRHYTISDENLDGDYVQTCTNENPCHHSPSSDKIMHNHHNIKNDSLSSADSPSNHLANSTIESSDSGLSPTRADINFSKVKLRPQEDKLSVGDKKGVYNKQVHHSHHNNHPYINKSKLPPPHPRPLKLTMRDSKKGEIGRRDSANFSLTSSQDTSSNESDHGNGLCSQV